MPAGAAAAILLGLGAAYLLLIRDAPPDVAAGAAEPVPAVTADAEPSPRVGDVALASNAEASVAASLADGAAASVGPEWRARALPVPDLPPPPPPRRGEQAARPAPAPRGPYERATPRGGRIETQAPAGAPAAPTRAGSVITSPQWARRPSAPRYPSRAEAENAEGHAVVQCVAQPNGRLTHCRVLEESPVGMGFGQAAVETMRSASVMPRTVDGTADPSTIRTRVQFRLED